VKREDLVLYTCKSEQSPESGVALSATEGLTSDRRVALRLSELPLNMPARVVELCPGQSAEEHALVMRLAELGFVPGEQVRVIAHGHPGREPIAVRVGNSTFGLRRFEAAMVSVMPQSRLGKSV
jgi:ferrous iron transport protein A